MDKFKYLSQIRGIAKAKRDQLCPPQTATLVKAGKTLAALTAASGTCEAMGTPLSKEFRTSLAEVLRDLRAFQSGYASNDPSQQIDPSAEPGFAETNMVKADQGVRKEKRVSIAEFGTHALSVLKAAAALEAHEEIAALDRFIAFLDKAVLDGDVSGVLLPVENDPDALKTTVETGSAASLASGTSSPSTASSNFATNPEAANGAAPSSAPASTSATMAAASASASQPATPSVPAPAGSGPAPSTANIATAVAASGGGDSLTVAKGAPAAAPVPPSVEELAKAGQPAPRSVGWVRDLNSREFLEGEYEIDFGRDGSK